MSVIPYAGRVVDLLAFQGQREQGDTLLAQELVSNSEGGELCTGVQRLAQSWLLEFLTIQGSLQYLPTRGCLFMQELRTGQLRTTLDVMQAFSIAAQQIKTNLRSDETDATPDDESFVSATLNGVTITGATLSISVTILSAAGTSAELILPITVNVLT